MRLSGVSGAVVLDGDGRVVASTGFPEGKEASAVQALLSRARRADSSDSEEDAARSSPGRPGLYVRSLPLEGGGVLLLEEFDAIQAWSRITRAFLHDLRGPMNSQSLFLEVLRNRLRKLNVESEDVEKCLSRIQEQVRRMDDLTRAFSELATTADIDESGGNDHESDVDPMCRAAVQLAATVTKRKDLTIRLEGSTGRTLPVASILFGEALVLWLGGALDAPAGSELVLTLAAEGEGVRLTLSGLPKEGERLVEAGLVLLSRCGAAVSFRDGLAEARFAVSTQILEQTTRTPSAS